MMRRGPLQRFHHVRSLSTTAPLRVWKKWNDVLSKEVDPLRFPSGIPPISVDTTPLSHVKSTGAMFIQGSPSCGKSSLARFVAKNWALANGYKEVCVPDTSGQEAAKVIAKKQALANANAEDSCLFIVDEAQKQILLNVVDPSGMYKAGFHVMYFGTTTRTSSTFDTPAELEPHKFWMYGPAVDRQQVRAYAERVLQYHGADAKLASRLAEQAFDYVGASMGMMMKLLRAIVDLEGQFPSPKTLLLNPDYSPRVVVNGNSDWEMYPGCIDLAKEILAVGHASITNETDDQKKNFLRRGLVAPIRTDLDSNDAIVPWRVKTGVVVGWAHSWQPTFCRIRKPTIQPYPTLDESQATVDEPIDALLRFLPAFDIETLVPNIVLGETSLQASEYNFQSQFDRAVQSAFSEAFVKNEVQTKGKMGKRGRLDFLLQPAPGDPKPVWWGYELLVRATDEALDEHKSRFATGNGKYNTLNWDDYLLLDCNTEPLSKSDVSTSAKVATISPHQSEGWNVIVLDYRGKRVNVPRDGVPRYVADWTNPKVKVAVKLFDPAHNVVLHLGQGKPNKTVRVPHRDNEKRAIGDIKMWLLKNVPELRGKDVGNLVMKDASGAVVANTAPVVDPMATPKAEHYHVHVK